MSIKTEVNRIKSKVGIIRDKFVSLGLAKSTDNLDALATAANGITPVGIGKPTITATAYDEDNEIAITARTNQLQGYVRGTIQTSLETYATLTVNGNKVTMECQGAKIERTVGASINTCNITINIVDNVGNIGVTATQFANGTVTTFRQSKSSGTFTIPNVICGSIITVICYNYFLLDGWTYPSQVADTSLTLIAPNTTGDYSANILEYD